MQPTMYRIRVRGSAFEGMCLEPGLAETRGQPEIYGSTDHPRLTHHPTKGDQAVSRKLRLRQTMYCGALAVARHSSAYLLVRPDVGQYRKSR